MKNFIVIGTLFLLLLIAGNSLFVVKETERAVMLQFGEVVNADIPPGLHVKIPWLTPFVNSMLEYRQKMRLLSAF